MRQKFNSPVLSTVLTPIGEIPIPTNSRNRLYPTLIALQEIYKRKPEVVALVLKDLLSDYEHTTNDLIDPILEPYFKTSPSLNDFSSHLGAPGMTAWQTLVAVALRQSTGQSYDDLEVHFNQNNLLREFLEIPRCDKSEFSESRLGKNCRKISPETIQAIDRAVVEIAVEGEYEDGKKVRADSFVCKTNIHYPSDTKAIEEACHKVIGLCVSITKGELGWRQYKHLRKKIKKLVFNLVQSKRSRKKDKTLKLEVIKKAYKGLMDSARIIQEKAFSTWQENFQHDLCNDLGYYMCCLEMMLELAERRTQREEKIDVSEKIFSIFEPHTALVNRGKYPLPIEYGHRVFIAEGKSGMILDHRVMENGVLDQHETYPLIERLCKRYGSLEVLSLDKGYNIKGFDPSGHEKVSLFALPSKGYKDKKKKEKESTSEFVSARKWRAGAEACISALMRGNGMDLCRDKKIRGYRRWVSACVLSRNLITLGRHILDDALKKTA